MTMVFDKAQAIGSPTADTLTLNFTPNGSIRGVLVMGVQASTVTDEALDDSYNPWITYGGVDMDPVPGSPFAHDATTGTLGTGNMWAYFLGSGVPQGTQEIVVELSDPVDASWGGVVWCWDADANMGVEDVATLSSASVANPSVVLSTSVATVIAGMCRDGVDAVSGISSGSSFFTEREIDHGNWVSSFQTWFDTVNFDDEADPGNITVDWNAATEHAGVFAVALRELAQVNRAHWDILMK